MPSTVAVLGTGTMGAAMAANIACAGLGLRVWNREPELTETVRRRFQLAVDSGLGRADVAATYRVSRRAEQKKS